MHNKKIIHLVCIAGFKGFGHICTVNGLKLSTNLRRLRCACVEYLMHVFHWHDMLAKITTFQQFIPCSPLLNAAELRQRQL